MYDSVYSAGKRNIYNHLSKIDKPWSIGNVYLIHFPLFSIGVTKVGLVRVLVDKCDLWEKNILFL